MSIRWNRRRVIDQRGSYSLFFVTAVVGMLAAVGLVVDGGRQVTAERHANAAAEDAARAAGQAISESALTGRSDLSVDSGRATSAAKASLAAAGVQGDITIDGTTLTVTTTATKSALFLPLVGITEFTVHGRATARLAQGGF